MENILKTVASSVGSPISTKKMSDTLISAGRKISTYTVDAYLRALTNSYILYNAARYDIKGRQYLKTFGKYYFVDTGIRNLIIMQSASDIGHLLENIVYPELLRRKNRVNIGKVAEKEVDFIAINMGETEYYQVSASVIWEFRSLFYRIARPKAFILDYVKDKRYASDRLQLSRAYINIEKELRSIFDFLNLTKEISMFFLLNYTVCCFVLAQRWN